MASVDYIWVSLGESRNVTEAEMKRWIIKTLPHSSQVIVFLFTIAL